MSDTAEEDTVVEKTAEEVVEESPAVDARAKAMGHSSKEDWRGNPEDWVDAKTFLERADSVMPILRERNKKLEAKLAQVEDRQNKLVKQLLEKEVRAIKAQQKEAVKQGDEEEFERADKALADLEKQKQEVGTQKEDPVFAQWQEDNPWYTSDFEKHDFANRYAEFLNGTGVYGKEMLDKVAAEVKSKFNKNPRRDKPSDAQQGGQQPRKAGRSYHDLPSDAKAACDRFVKQGVMTKDEYINNYEFE